MMKNEIVIKAHGGRVEKRWDEKLVITNSGVSYKKTYLALSSLVDYNASNAYTKVTKSWSYKFGKNKTDLEPIEANIVEDIYNELLKIKKPFEGRKAPYIEIIAALDSNGNGIKCRGTLSELDNLNDTILAVLVKQLVLGEEEIPALI